MIELLFCNAFLSSDALIVACVFHLFAYSMDMNMRVIGKKGEDIACEHLRELGYEIIGRNYTIAGGEIDIIALWNGLTYFIEVKYRTNDMYGHPLESISEAKEEALQRTLESYCDQYDISEDRVGGCLLLTIFDHCGIREIDLVDIG